MSPLDQVLWTTTAKLRSPARAVEYLVGLLGNFVGAVRAVRSGAEGVVVRFRMDAARLQAAAEGGPKMGSSARGKAKHGASCRVPLLPRAERQYKVEVGSI